MVVRTLVVVVFCFIRSGKDSRAVGGGRTVYRQGAMIIIICLLLFVYYCLLWSYISYLLPKIFSSFVFLLPQWWCRETSLLKLLFLDYLITWFLDYLIVSCYRKKSTAPANSRSNNNFHNDVTQQHHWGRRKTKLRKISGKRQLNSIITVLDNLNSYTRVNILAKTPD